MTHICVSELITTVSDNGLSPGQRQAIIPSNAGTLLNGTLGTNFSEKLIAIHTFSFKKIHLKMLSAKWCPFCHVDTLPNTSLSWPSIDKTRDHSVHASSQWEMALHCNAISHWLGAYTEWSLHLLTNLIHYVSLICLFVYLRTPDGVVTWNHQWPLLLTWINFNPSMDK